jgi:hypothetical protein
MPEARNSASQKALQHQALPMEAPSSVFSEELDTSAAFTGEAGQATLSNTDPTPGSQPGNIQRQLESGRLHSAQAQKLVMRAGNLYGNKATQQIVQRSMANKSRTQAAQPQREASQTIQRDFLGGITNFINTGNFPTNLTTPSLSTPSTNISVPNVTNLNKPPANKDFSNLPPGNTTYLGSIAPPPVPGNNQSVPNVPNLGNDIPNTDKPPANKDFSMRVPVEQLPPLPTGADGVIVAPGTVNTAQFGTLVDAKGNPIGLIILAEVLNGNSRGTVLSMDGTQVIQPGVPNTTGNGTGVNAPPVAAPIGTGGQANTPIRIQGYDPGDVLQQLPPNGSIGFLKENENPRIPGAARSSIGTVQDATGKSVAWVILDGPNAGDLYGYKNPKGVIGSVRPGATNNPFKPVATPPVSATPPQNTGLLDGVVTDVPTPVGVTDGDPVAAKPPGSTKSSPKPSPSPPSPAPSPGGGIDWSKLPENLKNAYDKIFGGDKKPTDKATPPSNRSSEADFWKAVADAARWAGADGKYPVKITVTGRSVIVDTSGNVNLDVPLPGVPVTGGGSITSTVDIQGRQVEITPITTASPRPGQDVNIAPPAGSNWQLSNQNLLQNSVPNNVRATLNFSAGASIPNSVIKQGVAGGWIRLMTTIDARGVQKPTYVLRDNQQVILIRNGQVAGVVPIGGIKLLPR